MSTLSTLFSQKKTYVGYFTAGDGGFEKSLSIMKAYAESGIDIIEVGVPFSDPVADGPVIQAAATRAIMDSHFTLKNVLELIKTFKMHYDTAIVLFSYFNPIMQFSVEHDFFKEAQLAGVDACLVVDLPLEEASDYREHCIHAGIDPIYVISNSTPLSRIEALSQLGRGMLYYACRNGVTGIKQALPTEFVEKISEIKAHSTLPVVVGFGVSNKETARNILNYADGFVVGSLFVKAAHDKTDQELRQLIVSLDPR